MPFQQGHISMNYNYFLFLVQIVVEDNNGAMLDRLSPWANYVVQPPPNEGCAYQQVVWHPPKVFILMKIPSLEEQQLTFYVLEIRI